MRIALCDSDIECIRKHKQMIYKYANNHRMEIVVDEYRSGTELLACRRSYALVILEYRTNTLNGLETAALLRKSNNSCKIVFLSAYTGFIFESFKVNPYRFLVKPIDEKILFKLLDDFFETRADDRPLWIKDGDDTVCLNTNDIFYLEADNKHCIIGLRNKKIHCRKTMAHVYDELPKNHFCKINRAYVVNFKYISEYNSDEIRLDNGTGLHISRSYYKSFKNEFRSFAEPQEL